MQARASAVSFLLWAPLTTDVKRSDLAQPTAPQPQAFAGAAKGFIRDYLGDVQVDNIRSSRRRPTGASPTSERSANAGG